MRGDAGGFAVDFLERSAASVDLLHLGVKAGSHGEAGGWEARGQVALGHEVIVENSFYSGSFQGIVLKKKKLLEKFVKLCLCSSYIQLDDFFNEKNVKKKSLK